MAIDKNDFEKFMNQARIKLPGASDAGIKVELYDVLKEFFEDSNSWREDIPLTAIAYQHHYSLVPEDGGQIIRLMGVWDHKRIPVVAFMPEFGELEIRHPPNTNPPDPWLVVVNKNITLPTTRDDIPVAPKWTLPVYSITILDGLLGKMMGQQSKSYSNGTMSAYHLRRFRTGIQIARTAAARQNTVGAQTWAYPRGWGSNTQRGGMVTAWPPETF